MGCSVGKVEASEKKLPLSVINECDGLEVRPAIGERGLQKTDGIAQAVKPLKKSKSKNKSSSPNSNQRAIKRSLSRLSFNNAHYTPKSNKNSIIGSSKASKRIECSKMGNSFSGRSYQISQNSISYALDATDGRILDSKHKDQENHDDQIMETPKKINFRKPLNVSAFNPASKRITKISGLSQIDQSTATMNRAIESDSPSLKANQSPISTIKEEGRMPMVQLGGHLDRRGKTNRTEGPAYVHVDRDPPRRAMSPKARVDSRDFNGHRELIVSPVSKRQSNFRKYCSNIKPSTENLEVMDSGSRFKYMQDTPVSKDIRVEKKSELADGCHIIKKSKQKKRRQTQEKLHIDKQAMRSKNIRYSQASQISRQQLIDPIPVENSSSTSMIEEFIAPKIERRPSTCSFEI